MYVYCVKELGLDIEKVNVNGGAIALGHPLDKSDFISGIDVVADGRAGPNTVYRCQTDRHWASRTRSEKWKGKLYPFGTAGEAFSARCMEASRVLTGKIPQILVTSMCIGTGMGAAAVFVRE